jgi:hypothetical protein
MAYIDEVLSAVRDPEWQIFRKSLKGMDTASKLNNLRDWYNDRTHDYNAHAPADEARGVCSVCTQIDNYLKALARGGQLHGGVSLEQALTYDWNLRIRK